MLDGLPEHGVLLTGSPENPVIENRSGRTVIAYVVRPSNHMRLAFSDQPAGIPDGGSLYANRGDSCRYSTRPNAGTGISDDLVPY